MVASDSRAIRGLQNMLQQSQVALEEQQHREWNVKHDLE
jgi:hypothetical protein